MKNNLQNRLQKALQKRQTEQNLRSLSLPNSNGIDFFSNDYLGLARSESLKEQILEEYEIQSQRLGNSKNGSTGSRLLSGHHQYFEELETALAQFFSAEKALFFASGYHANVAVLSSILSRNDVILYDSLVHVSLKEGYRLSSAQRFSFKHNDLEDLEKKIIRIRNQRKDSSYNVLIVVESVYSMDGDIAPLEHLIELSKKYDANLFVDEAHSTGLFGEQGKGLVVELGLENQIFARVNTFGKAFGMQGAAVLGSQILIDYLINFSLPFIYTTAPSLIQLVSVKVAMEFLKQNHLNLLQKLNKNIKLFEKQSKYDFYKNMPSTPIQIIPIEGNEKCQKIALELQKEGFEVRAIKSPTVPKGKERLRICLHSFNTKKEVISLCQAVKEKTNLF